MMKASGLRILIWDRLLGFGSAGGLAAGVFRIAWLTGDEIAGVTPAGLQPGPRRRRVRRPEAYATKRHGRPFTAARPHLR
jgi:hypothetical protein